MNRLVTAMSGSRILETGDDWGCGPMAPFLLFVFLLRLALGSVARCFIASEPAPLHASVDSFSPAAQE